MQVEVLSLYLSCRFFSPSDRTRVTTTNSTSSTSALICFSARFVYETPNLISLKHPTSSFRTAVSLLPKRKTSRSLQRRTRKAAEHQRSFFGISYLCICALKSPTGLLPSFLMDAYSFLPRSTLEHMPYALHDSPLRILTD